MRVNTSWVQNWARNCHALAYIISSFTTTHFIFNQHKHQHTHTNSIPISYFWREKSTHIAKNESRESDSSSSNVDAGGLELGRGRALLDGWNSSSAGAKPANPTPMQQSGAAIDFVPPVRERERGQALQGMLRWGQENWVYRKSKKKMVELNYQTHWLLKIHA